MRFSFTQPLQVATIVSRPNRFIMNVELNGVQHKAHCPTTGRIGDICFSDGNIPCLISESFDIKRKTRFTVEAISVLPPGPTDSDEWIGINQMRANTYVKHFLTSNQLDKMIGGEVRSEVSVGKSRLDFMVGENYLEVKMPLMSLPTPDHVKRLQPTKSKPVLDRLIKHFNELGDSIEASDENVKKKAILAMVYMYDSAPFIPPPLTDKNIHIMSAAMRAKEQGVENWQINMKIDKDGVELRDYFRLFL